MFTSLSASTPVVRETTFPKPALSRQSKRRLRCWLRDSLTPWAWRAIPRPTRPHPPFAIYSRWTEKQLTYHRTSEVSIRWHPAAELPVARARRAPGRPRSIRWGKW